jgi:hypothetical protein
VPSRSSPHRPPGGVAGRRGREVQPYPESQGTGSYGLSTVNTVSIYVNPRARTTYEVSDQRAIPVTCTR